MWKWIKRIMLGAAALVVVAVLVGVSYEMLARSRLAEDFPPPGRMIDIGGRRLQLDCRGSGQPVVIFEAGLDEKGSLSWARVHDAVSRFTRACAYSRAGIMWSDPRRATTGTSVAEDLHAALQAAGEQGPLVLVGHSLGGPYTMIYTRLFPSEVAGLVFVDASHPDQMARLRRVMTTMPEDQLLMLRALDALSWTGVARVALTLSQGQIPNQPAEVAAAAAAYGPYSLTAVREEIENLDLTLAEAGKLRTLNERPLYVLTARAPLPAEIQEAMGLSDDQVEQFRALWLSLQQDEATWSSKSRQSNVDTALHYIQFDAPERVIAAVEWVVGQVREESAPPAATED